MPEKKKVLVIDDNPVISELMRDELEELYEVAVENTGTSGVQRALASPPDAVLLDVNMPDLNGLQVLQYLAAYPQTAAVPVIIITAAEYNQQTEAYARQFQNLKGFLSKMSDGDAIRACLVSLIGPRSE